ncbi:2Fe-2S iron-sulfur cluster-binding protein [Pseudoprimorskyibacter insulae]|uniref:Putidaredoxin n=1 Tax=Pseudoprimorskyibacter insulae TaxID=1695997 RepID=A0A2R8AUF0_9RHOB|nr:2Fe-2S iron-sulfur cluster-binding protein [Pseudoprimorskyibacter insulae]SPF79514.1 Putidaredoxin [Pseudoprimorskyibacter insulae]
MVNVVFIEASGNRRDIDVPEGEPLMYAARDAGVVGIIAECGGSAMCATCHCYVVEAADGALPAPEANEADTIEFMGNEPRENSRLMCQVKATPALEGAVFEVATGRS